MQLRSQKISAVVGNDGLGTRRLKAITGDSVLSKSIPIKTPLKSKRAAP
jgi:hypothetical protein